MGGGDLFDAVQPDVGCGHLTVPYAHQLCSALAYMYVYVVQFCPMFGKPFGDTICAQQEKNSILETVNHYQLMCMQTIPQKWFATHNHARCGRTSTV